ncbi:MAG: DUF3267 domain-containing protein [Erysipelotrichaceae bacterium]|nr:DUF3267 domain-containing protein [Erysipelotrichaceae bacterium]
MHAIQKLPENYETSLELNLQKDKKTALKVNGLAVGLTFILMLIGIAIHPLNFDLDTDEAFKSFIIKMIVISISYIAYIILHEFTHGIAMKHYGGRKVQYGFTGLYAYAGSRDDYFDRYAYIRITLAPLVIWGIVFLILNIVLPKDWFWVIYFLQIGNISGAAGDIFVSWKVSKMPETLYVRDTGIDMTIYDRKNAA